MRAARGPRYQGALVTARSVLAALISTVMACSAANSSPGGSPGAGATGAGGTTGVGGSSGTGISIDAALGDGATSDDCKKVDVLFVIDDSASMADQQQSLIASFPGFVSAMKAQLSNAESYHVGVVTTDAYGFNDPACTKIGDLVRRTGGLESSNMDCGLPAGQSWIDGTDAALDQKFACIAQVGIAGADDERAARAVLDAADPARNAPGQCNAGFLRPDSLLVVVIVTDEDDVPDVCDGDPADPGTTCQTWGSGGTPDAWRDELVQKRSGVIQNIVVLSLLGRKAGNPCGAQVASKLLGFANRFGDNGFVGDVCAPTYDGFFAEALPVLEDACANYVPVF